MTEPLNTAPLPPDPVLGAVISNHPSNRLWPLIIGGIVDGVTYLTLNATLATLDTWWAPPLAIILMGIVVLTVAWSILHTWNREIVVFERGFSYREGSKTVFFHYDEIDALRMQAERRAYFGGLLRRTMYRFTVHTLAAETFTITNLYTRVAQLGEQLNQRVDRALIPRLERKFAAGATVPFGELLSLSALGLRADERDLAWEQFGGWEVKARAIHLKQADGAVWASIPLTEIDNITVLLHFLRAYQSVRSG